MNVYKYKEGYPSIAEDKQGWPWLACEQSLDESMPSGEPWPKISIVTPSYNQGEFIEETIRSVLLQGYPNLEYIIMDGGSSDQTIEVIKKYADWISYWVSEPDNGQSHAINKGFSLATGDILVWINSDDFLEQNSLQQVALSYVPFSRLIILGDVINFQNGLKSGKLVRQSKVSLENFIGTPELDFSWNQPGTFVSRECLLLGGELDESLHYAFDWDWMCKMLIHNPSVHYLSEPVARFRIHDESKTGGNMPACWEEMLAVIKRYDVNQFSKQEQRNTQSFYRVKFAELYLAAHSEQYWNRWKGIRSLCLAFFYNWGVVRDKAFLKLLLRAFTPKSLYRSKFGHVE